ncbi:MAG: CoA pyrophosphatase [Cyclobacteriaceae bacterium]
MKLDALTEFLYSRLGEKLPGKSAHDLMKPKHKSGAPIRIKHTVAPKEGGVLILLYEENGEVKFPLIRRPEYDGIHSGQVAFPGGRREDSDQDLIHTALREAEEEIGVSQNEVNIIGNLSRFFVAASNYDILPVIGFTEKTPEFRPDPREVSDILIPSAMDLIDNRNLRTTDITVRNGFKLYSPYFDLQDHIVWGATAMMLSELKAVLQDYTLR